MARREILILPDPRLRKVAAPIDTIDERVRALAGDMFETMYAAPGIGLAATQIGVLERLIVCDVGEEDEEEGEGKGEKKPRPMALVNPEVAWASEETAVRGEGCLSIPDVTEDVERPAAVRVVYRDLDGAVQEVFAEGLLATCLQHEIDHLNGVLFIDHISRLKRERIVKKFQKQARLATPPKSAKAAAL